MKKLHLGLLSALCAAGLSACSPQPSVSEPVQAKSLQLKQEDAKWWHSTVFYEIWPRSFYDADGDGSGDFAGMTAKLDYLQDLGVKGIWLTPIFEAPSYHGYDFQDFYAVESDYGSMADFETFIKQAHGKDMKVILDLVLNHISTGHEWFIKSAAKEAGFEDYFIWKDQRPAKWGRAWEDTDNPEAVWHWHEGRQQYYYGAFGASQPDVNLRNPEVVAELNRLAEFWLEKGVDGFRLDAVRYAVEVEQGEGAQQADTRETIDYWTNFTAFVKEINPDALLVAEAWADMPTIGRYADGGKGLDSAFDFDFGYIVAGILNNKSRSADFGTVNSDKAQNSRDALWQNLVDRQANGGISFYSPFLTNHDQERIMYALGNDWQKAKVAASLLMTTPGAVYIYYGEEIGLSQFSTGDDQYRRAIMQWDEQAQSAGFNQSGKVWPDQAKWFPWMREHKPWWQQYWQSQMASGNYSVAAQLKQPDSLLKHYQKLIQIRNTKPVLQTPEEIRYYPMAEQSAWLVEYQKGDDKLWVAINLDTQQQISVVIPKVLQGERKDLLSNQKVSVGASLVLNPGQTLIF